MRGGNGKGERQDKVFLLSEYRDKSRNILSRDLETNGFLLSKLFEIYDFNSLSADKEVSLIKAFLVEIISDIISTDISDEVERLRVFSEDSKYREVTYLKALNRLENFILRKKARTDIYDFLIKSKKSEQGNTRVKGDTSDEGEKGQLAVRLDYLKHKIENRESLYDIDDDFQEILDIIRVVAKGKNNSQSLLSSVSELSEIITLCLELVNVGGKERFMSSREIAEIMGIETSQEDKGPAFTRAVSKKYSRAVKKIERLGSEFVGLFPKTVGALRKSVGIGYRAADYDSAKGKRMQEIEQMMPDIEKAISALEGERNRIIEKKDRTGDLTQYESDRLVIVEYFLKADSTREKLRKETGLNVNSEGGKAENIKQDLEIELSIKIPKPKLVRRLRKEGKLKNFNK